MGRRIIIVEDFFEDNPAPIEEVLRLLADRGLKAFLASSVFASPSSEDEAALSEEPLPEKRVEAENSAVQTLLRQKTLLENELRQYRTLIENSGDIIYALDFGGNITFISNNLYSLLGFEPEEVIGRNFLDLLPPEEHVEAVTRFARQMQSQTRTPFVTSLQTKDGRRIPVEINGRNYYENNLPVLNIGLVRDITRRQSMETALKVTLEEMRRANTQLEEATRHKSEFLANMSHELRTPLNAIIGFSEILQDQTFGPLNFKQNRYVENILTSGKHLLALVNDVLDLAKVEAGKMELQMDRFAVRDILNDVFGVVAPLASKKNIGLASRLNGLSNISELEIRADRGRLRQILYNLLSNAIKFTPDGGQVEVSVTPTRREGAEWLELGVSDTGIGIRLEDQERIFEEFQMVDSTLSKRQQGTGLGLALSRRLAQLHGGSIQVKSVVGQGSTFTLEIPLEPLSRPQAGSAEALADEAAGSEERLALVIEDEDQSAELLQLYMEGAGYRVVRRNSGEGAVQQARLLKPSVITLDIVLPHKSGWDVLRDLKADPATQDIPVMVVSMLDNYDSSFALGAVACFVKPVRKEALLTKLKELELAAASAEGAEKVVSLGLPMTGQPLHALVIDDNPHDRELIGHALIGAGMQVVTAESGESGWAIAQRNPPDLVVLDLMMPGLDGFAVLRRLRQNLNTLHVPVFVFTAKDLNPTERAALYEAEAVLQKGDAPGQQLLEAVSRLKDEG